jgi:hypothetical protein
MLEMGLDPLERTREERRKAEEERKKAETAATTTLKAICEDWLTREGGMKRDADGLLRFPSFQRTIPPRCPPPAGSGFPPVLLTGAYRMLFQRFHEVGNGKFAFGFNLVGAQGLEPWTR